LKIQTFKPFKVLKNEALAYQCLLKTSAWMLIQQKNM